MIKSLKNEILSLAKKAVLKVENELSGEDGKNKKMAAIKYVIQNLPVPFYLKFILSVILSTFIDSSIEIAVAYMKHSDDVLEV